MVRSLFVLALMVTSTSLSAADDLKARFAGRLKAEVTAVNPTPISGLYEVLAGGQVVYMTEDSRYAIQGSLLDLEERRNLTEETRGKLRLAEFGKLPAGTTVDFPAKGEMKHTMYVFTDVDCGYCRKLHTEVPALNEAGVTVRYLAYPRGGLNSAGYKTMVSVWCSEDRQTALTTAKNGGSVAEKECDNPVKSQFELGNTLGVQGTPTIVLESGEELGGYAPAPQIIEMLNRK